MKKDKFVVIFVTAKDVSEAEKIATNLVKEKLAACCNIVNGVTSIFLWDRKIDKANEAMIIIKTKESLFKKIEQRIKALHSYSVPEIIALTITKGSQEYLNWIKASTS